MTPLLVETTDPILDGLLFSRLQKTSESSILHSDHGVSVSGHQPHKTRVKTSEGDSVTLQGSNGSSVAGALQHSAIPLQTELTNTSVQQPAKQVLQVSKLAKSYFVLPGSQEDGRSTAIFVDRKLPAADVQVVPNGRFTREYFVALHKLAAAPGPTWPAGTPNYMGARIPLQHTGLRMDRWRYHLTGFDDGRKQVLQLVEFGFPLGLCDDPKPTLVSSLSNHGSSYNLWVSSTACI